jgi:hypothetical protein
LQETSQSWKIHAALAIGIAARKSIILSLVAGDLTTPGFFSSKLGKKTGPLLL